MKLRFTVIILALATGCSAPKTNDNPILASDTTKITVHQPSANSSPDTTSFIGFIEKFDDNSTFYTNLYFVDTFNYDQYDNVKNIGDSVIYKDEETKRTRIPISEAVSYFNLTGLDPINIFDAENRMVATGRLSHIEYVEDMIESRFVAVFTVDNPTISNYQYCIGNQQDSLIALKYRTLDSAALTSALTNKLQLNPEQIWSIGHYKVNESDTVISTVSADTTAFIIESVNDRAKTIYKSKSSEAINGLVIIPKKVNGRAILLTDCGLPESDMTWTSLLLFNGTAYEMSRDHRTKH